MHYIRYIAGPDINHPRVEIMLVKKYSSTGQFCKYFKPRKSAPYFFVQRKIFFAALLGFFILSKKTVELECRKLSTLNLINRLRIFNAGGITIFKKKNRFLFFSRTNAAGSCKYQKSTRLSKMLIRTSRGVLRYRMTILCAYIIP